MEPEVRKVQTRFPEIDFLRFVAAISVVFFHYTYRGYAADNYSTIPFLEMGRYTRYGYLGVELFFIISGFVIMMSVQGKTLRQFFISRVTRLYPAYWVAVTLTFIVKRIWGGGPEETNMAFALHAGWGQYVFNLTMFQDFLGIAPMDGVYGTLNIEIAFYILLSLLMGYKLLRHVDWFLIAWLGLCCLPMLRIQENGTVFISLFFPANAPYFAAGMLFFLMREPAGRTKLRYALLLGFYLLALRSGSEQVTWLEGHYHNEFSRVVVASITTSFFVAIFLISQRLISLGKLAFIAALGNITYPLYLIHQEIAFIFFFRAGYLFNKYVLLISTIAVMILAAYLIYRFIEKPLAKPFGSKLNAWLQQLDR